MISVVGVLWVGGNAWISAGFLRSLEWRYLPPKNLPKAEVMVVLGGGLLSGDYPRSSPEVSGAGDRVIYAAQLYHQGASPHILVSGGEGVLSNSENTQAEDMAGLMEKLGVPRQAIWLEKASRNTEENAAFSWEILGSKGIRRIILITSAMHMPRAVLLFERQGFEVIPAPTDFSITQRSWKSLFEPAPVNFLFNLIPNVSNMAQTTSVLKEYLGLFYYQMMRR